MAVIEFLEGEAAGVVLAAWIEPLETKTVALPAKIELWVNEAGGYRAGCERAPGEKEGRSDTAGY